MSGGRVFGAETCEEAAGDPQAHLYKLVFQIQLGRVEKPSGRREDGFERAEERGDGAELRVGGERRVKRGWYNRAVDGVGCWFGWHGVRNERSGIAAGFANAMQAAPRDVAPAQVR
jgi:hypothetical protein